MVNNISKLEQKDCWMKSSCKKYANDASCESDYFCYKFFYLRRIYSKSLLTTKQITTPLHGLDYDSVDVPAYEHLAEIKQNIKSFVEEGKNLIILSQNAGNGKTSWSIELLKSYFNAIWPKSNSDCKGMFVELSRYFSSLKEHIGSGESNYATMVNENIYTADVIVWDDIGVKDLTEFEYDQFLSIINARINDGKSNIYTTNLTDNELISKLTKRLYSRVVGYSTVIEFKEKDHRRAVTRNE